jgi:hypothetical protein
VGATFNDSKEDLKRRAQDAMVRQLGDAGWTLRQKVALTCRALFDGGHDSGLAGHYATVAAALDIPIMAYNNPATSGIDMSPELLVQMFTEIDNLTMVKESTGDLDRMLRIKELTGTTLPFYNGSNPLILDALTAGASGWCTAPRPTYDHNPASTSTRRPRPVTMPPQKPSTKTFRRCCGSSLPADYPPRSRQASISSAPMSEIRDPPAAA